MSKEAVFYTVKIKSTGAASDKQTNASDRQIYIYLFMHTVGLTNM